MSPTHQESPLPRAMSENKKNSATLAWLLIVLCVFTLRVHAWLTSELWYDEVLTLQRFVIRHLDTPGAVFTDYPIANNHILSTWLAIQWMNLTQGLFCEWLLRLPQFAMGLAAIAVVMLHWRKFLGESLGALGGLMLAVSPVFTAYAYQLRGYSLTMLLGILAVSGALEVTAGRKARGQLLLCISGLLLPLVMPSNLMLAPVMAVMLLILGLENRLPWSKAALNALPWCLSIVLGGSFYLTIWPQFRKAMAEPDGWASPWPVLGNLLLGLAAHGLVLWAVWLANCRKAHKGGTRAAWWTLGAIAISVFAVMLAATSGHAPFPRVFLVMLPAATWAILDLVRATALSPAAISRCAAAMLFFGIVCERISEGITDYQLKHGYFPDNLLQHYYRGAEDLREISENESLQMSAALVLLNPYDDMTGAFYLSLARQPESSGAAVGVNRLNDAMRAAFRDFSGPKLAVASSSEEARNFFTQAGFANPQVRQIYRTASGRRFVFRLTP